MGTFIVKKSLNNNVLIANDSGNAEVVLIGKGLGFNRKVEDTINEKEIEKLFVLKNEQEQKHYKSLLPFLDEETLRTIIGSIDLIRLKSNAILSEHVHVALTDHILFAINRLMRGLAIKNPFLAETKVLYPFEYDIAAEVVDFINQSSNINLPEGEVGFIALHVHSAMTNKDVSDINAYSQLITKLVEQIEIHLKLKVDRESIDYIRLVRHVRYTIERVIQGENVEEPDKIASLLKREYPVCYSLSWKLIKIMQQTLKKPVYDAEAVYLTMHLQRLQSKYN